MEVSSSQAWAHPPGITDVRSSRFQNSPISCHQESVAHSASVCMIVCRPACSTRWALDPWPFRMTIRLKPW